tara:strand:+ start:53 stop:658 length:606 start_codon:yes stop_codon:yes gene_type:complete
MIKIELVEDNSQKQAVKSIIEKHHSYVASNDSVGRRIDWLVYHSDYKNVLGLEKPIGMVGIGSSVYPPPKDILRYVGMKKNEYKDNFNEFGNNWRFCMTTYIKNAGTQILKKLRKQAPIEWKKKYGDDLRWLITFVAGGNNGAVYKADNWKQIGETAGLPKHKAVSMKWHKDNLDKMFVKPTGENKKIIFIKSLTYTRKKS